MRTTTKCSIPLILTGAFWTFFGSISLAKTPLPLVFGVFYLSVGIFLARKPSPLARGLGIAAWAPFLLGFPIGTILAVLAIRKLRDPNCNVRPQGPPPEASSPEGRRSLVERLVRDTFSLAPGAFGPDTSFRDTLNIAPGHIISFLDDLGSDLRFRISGDDAGQVDSPQAILNLLEARHPYVQPVLKPSSP